MESQGTPAPTPVAGAPLDDGPRPGVQVRRNFLAAMRDSGGPLSRFNKFMILMLTLVTLGLSASILSILILTRGLPCDAPLVTFSAVYLIRLVVTYPLSMYQLLHPSTDSRGRRRILSPETTVRLQIVERSKSVLDLLGTIWFIMGNWWLFSSDSCSATNPPLYYISLTLTIMGYLVLAIPILFCVSVIFCLPCVLAVLRILRIGNLPSGTDLEQDHGLTDSVIAQIPVFKYRPKKPEQTAQLTSEGPSSSSASSTLETKKETLDETNVNEPLLRKSPSIFSFFSRLGRRQSSSMAGSESPLEASCPENSASDTPNLELSDEDALCVICLAQYEENDSLRMLTCQHHFHQSCIDEWLHFQTTCPLCVQEIQPTENPVTEATQTLPFDERRTIVSISPSPSTGDQLRRSSV